MKLLKNLSSSVRGGLLKQKLQVCMLSFYGKSATLMTFEGLMNRGTNGWMIKQTNKEDFGLISTNFIPNIN